MIMMSFDYVRRQSRQGEVAGKDASAPSTCLGTHDDSGSGPVALQSVHIHGMAKYQGGSICSILFCLEHEVSHMEWQGISIKKDEVHTLTAWHSNQGGTFCSAFQIVAASSEKDKMVSVGLPDLDWGCSDGIPQVHPDAYKQLPHTLSCWRVQVHGQHPEPIPQGNHYHAG